MAQEGSRPTIVSREVISNREGGAMLVPGARPARSFSTMTA